MHWKSLGTLVNKFKIGDTHEGEIKNITEFGLFVGLTDDVDAWFICLTVMEKSGDESY